MTDLPTPCAPEEIPAEGDWYLVLDLGFIHHRTADRAAAIEVARHIAQKYRPEYRCNVQVLAVREVVWS